MAFCEGDDSPAPSPVPCSSASLNTIAHGLESLEQSLSTLTQAQYNSGSDCSILQAKIDSIIQQLGNLKSSQEHHHVELLKLLDAKGHAHQESHSFGPLAQRSTLPGCVNEEPPVRSSQSSVSLDSHRFSCISRTSTIGPVRSHAVHRSLSVVSHISDISGGPSRDKKPLIEGIASEDFLAYTHAVPRECIAENNEDEVTPVPSEKEQLDPINRLGSGVGKGWFESLLGVTPGSADKLPHISKEEVETAVKCSLGDDAEFVRFMALTSRSSLKSHAIAEMEQQSQLIILPGWKARIYWDVLAFIVLLITGIFTPIGFAYQGWREVSENAAGVLFVFGDFIWLADIVINLSTAYTEGGKLVTSRWLILARYARGSLLVDLLTIWPIQLAMGNAFTAQLLLLLKMGRTVRVPQLFGKLQNLTDVTLYPTMILTIVALICNSLSCFWQVIQYGVPGEKLPNAVEEYVRDVYWVIMTMSTVGYGDITPKDTGERVYAIFVMFIAPLVFGAIVSLLSYNVQQKYNDKAAIQVARASRFMAQRCVPQDIQRRVQYNLWTNISQEQHFALASEILPKLSSVVQRELLCELMRSTVLQFPLFCGANSSFLGDITQAHSWVECSPGDFVMLEGQVLQEIVFVIKGRLLMQYTSSGGLKRKTSWEDLMGATQPKQSRLWSSEKNVEVDAGGWFGEACLFDERVVRDCNVVAVVESELAVLRASDYFKVLKKYPRVMSRHERIKADLKSSKLSFSALRHHPSDDAGDNKDSGEKRSGLLARLFSQ